MISGRARPVGYLCTRSCRSISTSRAREELRHEFDPDRALKIYASISDPAPASLVTSRYMQELLIKRLVKSRRFQDIETLLQSQQRDPRITEELHLCNLIRSYGLAGMLDRAIETFDQMEVLGSSRSTLSLNFLLSACNCTKNFDRVPQLFDEIPKKFDVTPDVVSYSILLKSFCALGLPDKAMETLGEMEVKGIPRSPVCFATALTSLYRCGRKEDAETLWNEMADKGFSPDIVAYNVKLMQLYGGKPEEVEALMNEIVRSGLKPNAITYNYVISAYCKNGMMADAMKVYRDLKKNRCHPNAAIFRTLIYYLVRLEDHTQAYRVFKASVSKEKIPPFPTLRGLFEGLVRTSRKDAEEMAITIKKKFPENLLRSWKELEDQLGFHPQVDPPSP